MDAGISSLKSGVTSLTWTASTLVWNQLKHTGAEDEDGHGPRTLPSTVAFLLEFGNCNLHKFSCQLSAAGNLRTFINIFMFLFLFCFFFFHFCLVVAFVIFGYYVQKKTKRCVAIIMSNNIIYEATWWAEATRQTDRHLLKLSLPPSVSLSRSLDVTLIK